MKAASTQITSSVDSEPRVMKVLGCGSWGQGTGEGMEDHKDKICSMCHWKGHLSVRGGGGVGGDTGH